MIQILIDQSHEVPNVERLLLVKHCNKCGRPIHHLSYDDMCWICYNKQLCI